MNSLRFTAIWVVSLKVTLTFLPRDSRSTKRGIATLSSINLTRQNVGKATVNGQHGEDHCK